MLLEWEKCSITRATQNRKESVEQQQQQQQRQQLNAEIYTHMIFLLVDTTADRPYNTIPFIAHSHTVLKYAAAATLFIP